MLCHCADCHDAESRISFVVMLSGVMLSVIMLIVISPFNRLSLKKSLFSFKSELGTLRLAQKRSNKFIFN